MALPFSTTETFNNLVTTTLRNYDPVLVPQIYAGVPIVEYMRRTGKVKMLNGGHQIAVGLVGAKNPNFEWYQGSTPATLNESTQFSRALYDWALCRVAVKISDQDIDINAGDKTRLHNLLMELLENARRTLIDEFSLALHSDGTVPGQLLGLEAIIPTTLRNDTKIGGINPTNDSFWDVNRVNGSLATLKNDMRKIYNQCIVKVPAPQRDGIIFVTTATIFEEYEDTLEDIARFMLSDARKESLGFGLADVLSFKGKPVLWDDAAKADEVRCINTNFLRLFVHNKRNFSPDPARTFPDAHATVSYYRFMGQLTTNFQDAQGVITSVT